MTPEKLDHYLTLIEHERERRPTEAALADEIHRLRFADEWLRQVLADAVDVFRRHDCRLDHMVGECHLCEIVREADDAMIRTAPAR